MGKKCEKIDDALPFITKRKSSISKSSLNSTEDSAFAALCGWYAELRSHAFGGIFEGNLDLVLDLDVVLAAINVALGMYMG